jgi:hypothetical protein
VDFVFRQFADEAIMQIPLPLKSVEECVDEEDVEAPELKKRLEEA